MMREMRGREGECARTSDVAARRGKRRGGEQCRMGGVRPSAQARSARSSLTCGVGGSRADLLVTDAVTPVAELLLRIRPHAPVQRALAVRHALLPAHRAGVAEELNERRAPPRTSAAT